MTRSNTATLSLAPATNNVGLSTGGGNVVVVVESAPLLLVLLVLPAVLNVPDAIDT